MSVPPSRRALRPAPESLESRALLAFAVATALPSAVLQAVPAAELDAAVEAAVAECIAQHQVTIVLDLGKVPLLSGRALELMTRTAARLAALGGWLKLAYPSPLLMDVLNVTGVAEQVALYDAQPNVHAAVPRPARSGGQPKLGDILVERGLLNASQVAEAARLQEQTGALESRRALTEAVLSGVSAGVVSIDRERIVTLINLSAQALLQTGGTSAIGRPLADVAPGLALAGDWSWHAYPATIESAVRSGDAAARFAASGEATRP